MPEFLNIHQSAMYINAGHCQTGHDCPPGEGCHVWRETCMLCEDMCFPGTPLTGICQSDCPESLLVTARTTDSGTGTEKLDLLISESRLFAVNHPDSPYAENVGIIVVLCCLAVIVITLLMMILITMWGARRRGSMTSRRPASECNPCACIQVGAAVIVLEAFVFFAVHFQIGRE